MKRQYDATEVERALLAIAEQVPGSFVGMDVIAGFPGESDEEFLDSVERLRRLPWTRLHVFPYSSRPGTFAARRTDHLRRELVKRRADILRALSDERHSLHASQQVGQIKQALVLRNGKLLSRDFWNLQVIDVPLSPNQEISVQVRAVTKNQVLVATPS
jgi:threonylcarbamoyladenosine tRNA methylthiotransferase MtaB